MNVRYLLFIGVLVLLYCAYDYSYALHMRPSSIHQWRQADCLSITQNYYQHNLPFLEPQIHWMELDGNSKSVGEFPLIYYIVAKIWLVIGKSEAAYRILNCLIMAIGLLYLFRLALEITKNTFYSLVLITLLSTSPIFIYYGNNFLVDVPALSLIFIGFYFVWKYYQNTSLRWLWLAHVFFITAGLLKVTALLAFFAFLVLHLVYIFRQPVTFKTRLFAILPSLVLILTVPIWYIYAQRYSAENVRIFLLHIIPIWELETPKIVKIATILFNDLSATFLNTFVQGILFFMACYCMAHFKKGNTFLMGMLLLVIAGSIAYLLLFFKNFDVHDYYLIHLLVIVPMVLLTFFDLMRRLYPEFYTAKWVRIPAIILLIYLVTETASYNRIRYTPDDDLVESSFLIKKSTREYYNWLHYDYARKMKALETIEPYLASKGIGSNDRIISIPDESPNISLYLMNCRGFTDFGHADLHDSTRIDLLKKSGANYLIINDTTIYTTRKYLQHYAKNKIGNYKNISIYKL